MRANEFLTEELLKRTNENKLFVKKLTTEQALIEHARLFAKNLPYDGVPVTSKNRYTVVCSTIFAHGKNSLNESAHIASGKQVIQLLKKLDQFPQLQIKIGAKVAIINLQLQGDSIELWGFTTPKTISKIYRDPSDKSIKQFEFNNDPNDVWPRTENAEYNGKFLMYSAFFGDKKSADQALTMVMLQSSGDLNIRNHITEQLEQAVKPDKLAGTLQLYMPRPRKVEEILKPTSGFMYSVLWTSTAEKTDGGYTSEWVEWCKNEMPEWITDKGILYRVKPGARILNMNTDKDAYKIAQHYGIKPPKDMLDNFRWTQKFPWDEIENDFDGIHHIPSGPRARNILMSAWDVESTAWFNKNHLENLGEVSIDIH